MNAFGAAAPEPACFVDAKAIEKARRAVRENLAAAQCAVFPDVKDPDMRRQVLAM